MLRDIAQVRAATELVVADLRRVLGGTWSIRLDDGWVLTLSDGARTESALVDGRVEDEEWYVDERWPAEEQAAALAADAAEAVATEVVEILRAIGASPITCPTHGAKLGSCEGVWYCDDGGGHDIAVVGCLGADGGLPDEAGGRRA